MSDYVRFCTVLTAFAESDFRSDAVQKGKTFGVFQQDPRWWPSATEGTDSQCRAFVKAFTDLYKIHTGNPVVDCWLVQRWEVPGSNWPKIGPEFLKAPETVNYSSRVEAIDSIIKERKL